MLDAGFWAGRRVFLTGHTGFKGSWLSLMLSRVKAEVTGYALEPPTRPSLFEAARVAETLTDIRGDVTDLRLLEASMHDAAAEIVIHMAAQPLVKAGYADPVGTYATNVMGTVNVLDAARRCPTARIVVVVTTDKCYENLEGGAAFAEGDRLGGHDPYSNSKACAELATAAYRDSFHAHGGAGPLWIASARAGNVIGGGDFAANRIVTDAVRAFGGARTLEVRNPAAVRPWQHVLDPLLGYLLLAQNIHATRGRLVGAWNFGPPRESEVSVEVLLTRLIAAWGEGAHWQPDTAAHPHEAGVLRLDSSKAMSELGWAPLLSLDETIEWTAHWYKSFLAFEDVQQLTLDQVDAYLGHRVRLSWPGNSPIVPPSSEGQSNVIRRIRFS